MPMNLFREDARQELAFMGRARVLAQDARREMDSRKFSDAVGDFANALQGFVASLHLAEVLR